MHKVITKLKRKYVKQSRKNYITNRLKKMIISLRKARYEDREKVIQVEAKATPNLNYVGDVWNLFTTDEIGDFLVAEADGEVVACGKFTILPDRSAWLETLRVIPDYQGLGIGKRFYKKFYELAKIRGVSTMRMYTGVKNVVSKGLAERFGFHLAARYRGASLNMVDGNVSPDGHFKLVKKPEEAYKLLHPFKKKWTGFLVMNRTFYTITNTLAKFLIKKEMLYYDAKSCSTITVGARFLPERALHIGVFSGDIEKCLDFAIKSANEVSAARLNCDFPYLDKSIEKGLVQNGFSLSDSDFIVMETNL
jgi:N-acetylglutamate synthase-like GNAT family acetyltransferase